MRWWQQVSTIVKDCRDGGPFSFVELARPDAPFKSEGWSIPTRTLRRARSDGAIAAKGSLVTGEAVIAFVKAKASHTQNRRANDVQRKDRLGQPR